MSAVAVRLGYVLLSDGWRVLQSNYATGISENCCACAACRSETRSSGNFPCLAKGVWRHLQEVKSWKWRQKNFERHDKHKWITKHGLRENAPLWEDLETCMSVEFMALL